jgi:hypothetical protein
MPYFNNTTMDPIIDSLANVIRSSVYSDNLKSYTNQQFEDNITMQVNSTPGIKSFISARTTSLTSQLSFTGCWLGVTEANSNAQSLSVYPNPSSTSATIVLPAAWNSDDCTLNMYDAAGRIFEMENASKEENNSIRFETSGLANGIYFLKVTNASGESLQTRISVMH